MGFISDRDQETIRKHFEDNLVSDVELVLFTQRPSMIIVPGRTECQTCSETEQLLQEVSALSDKLKLTVYDASDSKDEFASHGIGQVPVTILKGSGRGNIRFFGIPSGYEFSAFIEDIVDSSKGATRLSEETKNYLAGLTQDVNIKVFTTPT